MSASSQDIASRVESARDGIAEALQTLWWGESPDDREPERYALDTLNQAYIDLAGRDWIPQRFDAATLCGRCQTPKRSGICDCVI